MPFLDQFDVVLLDMNGTFMFGHDRLGPEEDFYQTYQAVGGRSLEKHAVTSIMRSTCDTCSPPTTTPPISTTSRPCGRHFRSTAHPRRKSRSWNRCLPSRARQVPTGSCALSPWTREDSSAWCCFQHLRATIGVRGPAPGNRADGVFTHTIFSSQVYEHQAIAGDIPASPGGLRRRSPGALLWATASNGTFALPAVGSGHRWIAPPGTRAREADVVIASLPELATVAT